MPGRQARIGRRKDPQNLRPGVLAYAYGSHGMLAPVTPNPVEER